MTRNSKTKYSKKRSLSKLARRKLNQNLQRAESLLQIPGVPSEPAVAAALAKAGQAQTNREALEANLILERILLGENSTLDDPGKADKLQRNRADAEARDAAAAAFARDAEGFVEGIYDDAETKKLTGSEKERAMANVAHMKQSAMRKARARQIQKNLQLDWEIEHGPKRDVSATGSWVMIGSVGSAQPRLEAEVVRIMDRQWVLKPGLNKGVPSVFADSYEQTLVTKSENAERERALGKSTSMDNVSGMEFNALQAKLAEIDRRYGGGG